MGSKVSSRHCARRVKTLPELDLKTAPQLEQSMETLWRNLTPLCRSSTKGFCRQHERREAVTANMFAEIQGTQRKQARVSCPRMKTGRTKTRRRIKQTKTR